MCTFVIPHVLPFLLYGSWVMRANLLIKYVAYMGINVGTNRRYYLLLNIIPNTVKQFFNIIFARLSAGDKIGILVKSLT